eukprot:365560-Chlamydomonas_euryale.AAC.10
MPGLPSSPAPAHLPPTPISLDRLQHWSSIHSRVPSPAARRPVKRAVQRELENALAKGLLAGEFKEDDTVIVSAGERSLALRAVPTAAAAVEAQLVAAGARV